MLSGSFRLNALQEGKKEAKRKETHPLEKASLETTKIILIHLISTYSRSYAEKLLEDGDI